MQAKRPEWTSSSSFVDRQRRTMSNRSVDWRSVRLERRRDNVSSDSRVKCGSRSSDVEFHHWRIRVRSVVLWRRFSPVSSEWPRTVSSFFSSDQTSIQSPAEKKMLDNLNFDESSDFSQQNERHCLFELITVITAKRMTLEGAFLLRWDRAVLWFFWH